MKNYLKNIDEAAFHAWLRSEGWVEDTSSDSEMWDVPGWWHEGKMKLWREDWLVDNYDDHLYDIEQAQKK